MSETYQAHPLRFQLSRKKGYRKPEGGVVVARPSKWGNPFTADWVTTMPAKLMCIQDWELHGPLQIVPVNVDQAVALYRVYMLCEIEHAQYEGIDFVAELRGKLLGCWCPLDRPCHADVLCELANKQPPSQAASPSERGEDGSEEETQAVQAPVAERRRGLRPQPAESDRRAGTLAGA